MVKAAGEVKARGARPLALAASGWFQRPMRELRRTNDLVYLSFAEAAQRAEGLHPVILDEAASAMDGSIGALPRRLVIPAHEEEPARRALAALDLEDGR